MHNEGMRLSSWGVVTNDVVNENPETEMKFRFVTNHSKESDVFVKDAITIFQPSSTNVLGQFSFDFFPWQKCTVETCIGLCTCSISFCSD